MADDNDEYTSQHEGDPVIWVRLVCRGLEGGLRETVAANEPRHFHRGEVVTLAVDTVVDYVAYPPHKPLDADDDEEGVDRLHITKLATVAIIDRLGAVADSLDAQALRNAAARSEREAAREAKKQEKAEARKAAKEAAKAAKNGKAHTPAKGERPLFNGSGDATEPVADAEAEGEPDDLTDAERRAVAMVG